MFSHLQSYLTMSVEFPMIVSGAQQWAVYGLDDKVKFDKLCERDYSVRLS